MQFFKRKFEFVKLENKLSASEFGFVKQDESIFFVEFFCGWGRVECNTVHRNILHSSINRSVILHTP